MDISTENFAEMRAWLACVTPYVFPPETLSEETDPIGILDAIAAESPAQARQGLSMAIADIVEMTDDWSDEQLTAVDLRLTEEGLPGLYLMRARFSKAIQRIMRRGRIIEEVEYYAIRNAAEMAGEAATDLWDLIAVYEDGVDR